MTYDEVLELAKTQMGGKCLACPSCNGKACRDRIPGPGAKGSGTGAIKNYDAWQNIRVNMDTLVKAGDVDTGTELFGRKFKLPVFAGPVGAISMHYAPKYTDQQYNEILIDSCSAEGIAAFTGDGLDTGIMQAATQAIAKAGGVGIPTIKPWNINDVTSRMEIVKASGAFAVAMDIDGAGLPFLRNMTPRAGSKSVEELRAIIAMAERPFIVKGVMNGRVAEKAIEAGASAVVVSNHGGRVLDGCPATAEVLSEVVKAVDGRVKVLVDGGIRTGLDIFRALALGADGVIIARPFVYSIFGAAHTGVKLFVDKLHAELIDVMTMCGALSISEITRDMVRSPYI